jgi:hypothetical protein
MCVSASQHHLQATRFDGTYCTVLAYVNNTRWRTSLFSILVFWERLFFFCLCIVASLCPFICAAPLVMCTSYWCSLLASSLIRHHIACSKVPMVQGNLLPARSRILNVCYSLHNQYISDYKWWFPGGCQNMLHFTIEFLDADPIFIQNSKSTLRQVTWICNVSMQFTDGTTISRPSRNI